MKMTKILGLLLALALGSAAQATELIATGTGQVDSADIPAPFSLFIKPATGNTPPPSGVDFWLQKKNAGGSYNTVAVINAGTIAAQRTWTTGGNYRVERQPATDSAGMDYEVPTGAGSVVSGTVTANLGTLNGAATAANQTGTQQTAGSTKFDRVISAGANGVMAGNPTYKAVQTGYTAYATPTDLFCISGSATKLVIPTVVSIYSQSTAATLETWTWIKRSTLNTGGTSSALTANPYDSTSAAATATVTSWTAAPGALGTSAGTMFVNGVATTALTGAPAIASFYISPNLIGGVTGFNTPIVLRNQNESLCMNFGGAALPSGFTSTIDVQWIEFTAP